MSDGARDTLAESLAAACGWHADGTAVSPGIDGALDVWQQRDGEREKEGVEHTCREAEKESQANCSLVPSDRSCSERADRLRLSRSRQSDGARTRCTRQVPAGVHSGPILRGEARSSAYMQNWLGRHDRVRQREAPPSRRGEKRKGWLEAERRPLQERDKRREGVDCIQSYSQGGPQCQAGPRPIDREELQADAGRRSELIVRWEGQRRPTSGPRCTPRGSLVDDRSCGWTDVGEISHRTAHPEGLLLGTEHAEARQQTKIG